MQETKKQKITTAAINLLLETPTGLRFSELVKKLQEVIPGERYGNFTGSIWDLDSRLPKDVYKPSRGLFRHTKFLKDEPILKENLPSETTRLKEEVFYEPFADWLVAGIEECTIAVPLGRNYFKSKWNTPDVIGLFKSRESDIFKTPMEVVVAEIKIDGSDLITAFGQACAYKLFAHKSYLVIPDDAQKEDIDRLDSLCLIFGIGLILFDSDNVENPDFKIRVRASRHEPDAFYVNKNLKLIADKLSL